MTDPMELVERLEKRIAHDKKHYPPVDPLFYEAAACIRELVEWRPMSEAPKDRIIIAMARYVDASAGSPTLVGWDGDQWCEFTRHAPSPVVYWGWKDRDVLGEWPKETFPPAPGTTP